MAEAKKVDKKDEVVEAKPKKTTKATTETEKSVKKTVAKAGKRSAKASAETEEKVAKKVRKAEAKPDEVQKPAAPKHTPKNLDRIHSKKWRESASAIDKTKLYELTEAIELLQKVSKTKFDATAELHVNLGIDPRQSDQQVREAVTLPAGSGKSVRIAVIADSKNATAAKAAGADLVDSEKILASVAKSKFDFDVLVTTPDQMAALAKHAKILGPKGLMPNPKAGTVTNNIEKTVKEIKAGKVEIKTDAAGIVHLPVGKISFKPVDLSANIIAIIDAITRARPSGVKGVYIKSITIAASMSPSIKLDLASMQKSSK